MAVLLVELHGIKRGSVLPRRVLIGRRSMNHLVIDDPAVSRMHAWIEGEGDRYYINDAGSRTGTRVNGQRIVSRHLLGDEDEISVGPAKLTFLAESRLRPGVAPIDLASPPNVAPDENGIAFDCPSCHAPLWASRNFAGGTGQCKYCGGALVVPGLKPAKPQTSPRARTAPPRPANPGPSVRAIASVPSPITAVEGEGRATLREQRSWTDADRQPLPEPAKAPRIADSAAPRRPPAPAPAIPRALTPPAAPMPSAETPASRRTLEGEQICGVCHSAISVFEEQTSCPTCGLVFHADCWTENYGCSAYGCPQVNALAPPEAHDHSAHAGAQAEDGSATAQMPAVVEDDNPARFPWEFLLLAGSVFSALVGALTFGLPSLALAGGTVAYMARTRGNDNNHRGIVMLSAGLAALGVIAGIPVSWFLYFGGPHL